MASNAYFEFSGFNISLLCSDVLVTSIFPPINLARSAALPVAYACFLSAPYTPDSNNFS